MNSVFLDKCGDREMIRAHFRPVNRDKSIIGSCVAIKKVVCRVSVWITMLVAFIVGTAVPSVTNARSLTGTLTNDDDHVQYIFDATSPFVFSAQTWSFGGGVNQAGQAIPAGGFAPVLSLFSDGSNTDLLAVAQAGVTGCGLGRNDPGSGFCWDVALSQSLKPGKYRLVLTQDDNTPLGPLFGDGFLRDGTPDFTGQNIGAPGSKFVLIDGTLRNGNWALDLNVPVPIPPLLGVYLLLFGLGVLAPRFSHRRF